MKKISHVYDVELQIFEMVSEKLAVGFGMHFLWYMWYSDFSVIKFVTMFNITLSTPFWTPLYFSFYFQVHIQNIWYCCKYLTTKYFVFRNHYTLIEIFIQHVPYDIHIYHNSIHIYQIYTSEIGYYPSTFPYKKRLMDL